MADLFVLVTYGTEPFVTFVCIVCDQSATLTVTLTKFTCALHFTLCFLFVVIEACMTPNVSVAQVTSNSNPFRYTGRTYHSVATCLFARVFHTISTTFVTTLANLSFSHSACKVTYDVIVTCHLVK